MSYILIIFIAVVIAFLGIKFISKRKDKLSLSVFASIILNKVGEREDVKGTIAIDDFGIRHEMLLNVKVINSGEKSFEISHVFITVELEKGVSYEIRITPDDLPKVVEECSSIEINIQKEWLDYENVNSLGVIDSKGKHYYFPKKDLDKLWIQSNDLPSYKDRSCECDDSNEAVKSFEAKDKSQFIKKN